MKKILLFLLCLLVMTTSAEAAQLNNVAAVVNGKVITMFDLQKACHAGSGACPSQPQ